MTIKEPYIFTDEFILPISLRFHDTAEELHEQFIEKIGEATYSNKYAHPICYVGVLDDDIFVTSSGCLENEIVLKEIMKILVSSCSEELFYFSLSKRVTISLEGF